MINRSSRLNGVNYEIKGPIYQQAMALEKEGHSIIKLHIGNPAPFGFDAPAHIRQAIVDNLFNAQGYVESRGIAEARVAIAEYYAGRGLEGISADDVFVGNGVSDLILMSMQALLENGDEVLVPMPDYPLWTSSVRLFGGKAVHYLCDEQADWFPDINDIKQKITAHTRAIVVINPNNPTGAVYSTELLQQIVELARQHNLIIFADEIYDKILYDAHVHTSIASLANDVVCVTMSGLTKNYCAAGYRAGWMVLSGAVKKAASYKDGLSLISNMRVCSSVIAQYAIKPALEGHNYMEDLVQPNGRLWEQRELAYNIINQTPGLSCVKPKGAFYLFAKMDLRKLNLARDTDFVLDVLKEEKVLVVQGTGFNYHTPDHFRVVFLPNVEELRQGLGRIAKYLERRALAHVNA